MSLQILQRLNGTVAVVIIAFVTTGSQPTVGVSADATQSNSAPATDALKPIARTVNEQKVSSEESRDWKGACDILTAFGTVAAAVFAWLATRQAKFATLQTQRATERSEEAAKAQRLADLWPDMAKLTFLTEAQKLDLDNDTVAEIVRSNVNLMEKIAFWWETDLVDRAKLLAQVNAQDNFISLYEQIKGLANIRRFGLTGQELLDENPNGKKLYAHLKELNSTISQQS